MTPRLLVVAQVLDASTLWLFYQLGLAGQMSERNPLTLAIMAVGGIGLVAAVKVGVALVAAHRFPRFMQRKRVRVAMWAAIVSGCIGASFNTFAIVYSLRL